MKVQAHNSLEPPLEYNHDQMPSMNHGSNHLIFLTIVGVTEILYSFRLVLEGKTGNKIPESSRLEFLEKFLSSSFALSDAEVDSSGPLNRGGIADLTISNLPKVPRATFVGSDRFFCFVSICKFISFKNPFANITNLLNFPLNSDNLFCWYANEKKSDFNELSQQYKQLKTMEVSEA